MKIKFLRGVMAFMLLLTGCAAETAPTADVLTNITSQEAEILMRQEDIIILDVRTPAEFAAARFEGAVLVPHTEILEQAAAILPDKTQTILIYCRTGRRSLYAAADLAELGYTSLYNLLGGIEAWHGTVAAGP